MIMPDVKKAQISHFKDIALANDYLRNLFNLAHALYLKTPNNTEIELDAKALRRYAEELVNWASSRETELHEVITSPLSPRESTEQGEITIDDTKAHLH